MNLIKRKRGTCITRRNGISVHHKMDLVGHEDLFPGITVCIFLDIHGNIFVLSKFPLCCFF